MKKQTELEKLTAKKQRLEERWNKERQRTTAIFSNLGWGTGMRGYKKLSSLSYSKEDKIRDQLEAVTEQLKALQP